VNPPNPLGTPLTISKVQGQTLKPVAIYLPSSVFFPQGQLYAIINRSLSFDSVGVANNEDYIDNV
jgi:hypothetical protein